MWQAVLARWASGGQQGCGARPAGGPQPRGAGAQRASRGCDAARMGGRWRAGSCQVDAASGGALTPQVLRAYERLKYLEVHWELMLVPWAVGGYQGLPEPGVPRGGGVGPARCLPAPSRTRQPIQQVNSEELLSERLGRPLPHGACSTPGSTAQSLLHASARITCHQDDSPHTVPARSRREGDPRTVMAGYARNYLIPQKMAVYATRTPPQPPPNGVQRRKFVRLLSICNSSGCSVCHGAEPQISETPCDFQNLWL